MQMNSIIKEKIDFDTNKMFGLPSGIETLDEVMYASGFSSSADVKVWDKTINIGGSKIVVIASYFKGTMGSGAFKGTISATTYNVGSSSKNDYNGSMLNFKEFATEEACIKWLNSLK